ncbi:MULTISPECIES: LysM peptidoglycan-binding domain-containing protein [unclassified Pseudoalteromonas]|uniref:LysM peptidoglycan-binding domain-containing protein n=1 Tax=unclassified Pseudoalteromonas TaxID=194690 RepID=UPI000CF648F5|nr:MULTISPECIES: LysM peptidoglycan-binding domain-containing protein [unclassified Pseudoalteromonas]
MYRILLISFFLVLAGCQTTPSNDNQTQQDVTAADNQNSAGTSTTDNASAKQSEQQTKTASTLTPQQVEDVWQRIRMQLSFADSKHPAVQQRIDWYLSHPNYMEEISRRAEPYLYHIVTEVEKRELPIELALMPLIESDFDASAYSHKHASGLWQLTPSLAKYFGVKISPWYDGRQDVIDSTQAALDFIEYLHKRFDGDWYHTIAAYNVGEGRVLKAIESNKKAGKSTDFFALKLPKQTRHYVPKLLAAVQLLKHQKMEFPLIANQPSITTLPLSGAVVLADKTKWGNLEQLNHGVIRFPAIIDAPHIVVPVEDKQQWQTLIADQQNGDYSQWQNYTIAKGDSLSVIAKRYSLTVQQLKTFNNLKSDRIRIGDKLILPVLADEQIEYKVASGDSLWKIARRYQVSVAKLKQWNNLSKDTLRIGETLTLFLSRS